VYITDDRGSLLILKILKPLQTPLNKAHPARWKRRNKERGLKSEPKEQNPNWVTKGGVKCFEISYP
jgi:hypothetical protein